MDPTNSVNIYDVAKEANVSIATVSRVLNNNPNVSSAMKQKVNDALQKLDYQPSGIARALVSKKMQTVGIMTVDIRSALYAVTAYTIERQLSILGYNSILCNTFGSTEDNIKYVRMLLDKGVSGIICIGSVFDKTFNETNILEEYRNTPFIMTNYQINADNVCSVVIDEKAAMEKAVNHLIERGHKDILYVRDMDTYSANHKVKIFLDYMSKQGLESSKKAVFVTDRSIEGGERVAEEILNSGVKFSAILANDDITAVGCMKKLKEFGYSTPEDVAIVGYNNTIVSECCTPRLTTVDNKFETVGTFAVTLLKDLIEAKNTPKSVTIMPELIIKEST